MKKSFILLCLTVLFFAFAATSYAYTLTVASSNPSSGVAITVSPNDTQGRNNGTTQFTRSYNSGTVVSLTAPAGMTGKVFQKWRKGSTDYATTRATTVTITASTTMTAYYLSDTTRPITTASPAAGTYTGSVTVTLTPNETATTYYCTSGSSCTPTTVYTGPLTFTSTKTLRYYSKDVANNSESTKTATYTITAGTAYTLTVASSNPTSGVAITVSPNDRNGQGNGTTQFTRSYNSGAVVTVTAPATSTGGSFLKWQKGGVDYATTANTTVTMSAATTMTAVYGTASTHASITGTFTTPAQVTAKCLECHASQGTAVVNSLHGMMPTLSPNVTNATGLSQKLGEINTFCSYPNPDMAAAACLNCHPTLGKFENLAATDIDCLQCHNDSYKRRFIGETDPAKFINVVDWQGTPKTYVPAWKDTSGNFQIEFNWAAMPGITALDLVRGAKKPTTTTCLSCHAKAGGGDWVKRGDIGLNSATATSAQDIHLASVANGGAGLTCTSCHVPANHKIPGRGIDLRPTETGVTVKKCVDCHVGKDTTSGHTTTDVNRHVARVACQACHIPQFGKGGATEMSRNWTLPTWNAGLCNGQGAWAGEEIKLANVASDLAFFNGTSYVYKLGQFVDRVDPVTGYKMLAEANGGVNDPAGVTKLVSIKRHRSNMAIMSSGTDTGKLIPFDVVWQFMTGFSDEAAERGKTFAGYTGTHTWQWVEAEMAINHGVGPKSTVLCTNCHDGTINTSVDSKLDKLGYKAKKPTSDLCNDCHGIESVPSHTSLHSNHRSRAACSSCHNFTRP